MNIVNHYLICLFHSVGTVNAQGTAKIHVFDYVEDELTGPGDPVLVLKESKPPASILFEVHQVLSLYIVS